MTKSKYARNYLTFVISSFGFNSTFVIRISSFLCHVERSRDISELNLPAALVQVRIKNAFHLERGRLLVLGEHRVSGRETRAIKVSAQRKMYPQRHNQSEPEPVTLLATRQQTFGLEAVQLVEIGYPHAL